MAGMVGTNPHAARSAEIALGLRAARVLALVRKVRSGVIPLGDDRSELEAIRVALVRAADTATRGPSAARVGGRRNIASVGLALTTAVRDTPTADRVAAAARLRDIASDLEDVIRGQPSAAPDRLTAFLGALVSAADRSTTRRGEILVTVES